MSQMKCKPISVVFENLGETLETDPYKTYVFYFLGAFFPAHRGHMEMITHTLAQYQHLPNIYVIINQVGDEHRHGVPVEIGRHIMKMYVRNLPFDRSRISLLYQKSIDEVVHHPFVKMSDIFVRCRAYEYEDESPRKIQKVRHHYQNDKEKQGSHALFLKKKKEVVYLISRRQKSKVSSTLFIRSLREGQHKMKKGVHATDHLREAAFFLPPFLSEEEKNRTLQLLFSCHSLK